MKIKLIFLLLGILIIPIAIIASYTGGTSTRNSEAVFDDVEGKEWHLSEVKSALTTITLDRKSTNAYDLSGIYSITFAEGRVSGMGAPNRYFGPYTLGENKALTMGAIGSTRMAAFGEPDTLKEHEYFHYLWNVTRWDLRNGKLELYSTDENGIEAILVFDRF